MGHGLEDAEMPLVGPALVCHPKSNLVTDVLYQGWEYGRVVTSCRSLGRLRVVYAIGKSITDIHHGALPRKTPS
jgi:hypothetical protein